MEPFIGQIQAFAFNFVPRGWLACAGQTLDIASHTALFSLLGTQYGGDGRTTFKLPDLRGRVLINQGTAPGLSPYICGEMGGIEEVTLSSAQIPSHTHSVSCSSDNGNVTSPVNAFPAAEAAPGVDIWNSSSNSHMNAYMISSTGGGLAHENRQPFMVVNWCIAIEGIFPSRS